MSRTNRSEVNDHWGAFNEANAITALVLLAIGGVTYFAGKYDYVSILEYWTLAVVCTACAIYIGKSTAEKRSKVPLVALALFAMGGVGLIYYRQNLRYNDYDASWDVAFSNSQTEYKTRGVQIGLCLLNPNNFPIYIRIATISANVDKSSGAYANRNPDRILKVGRYSANAAQFSDPMAIGEADSGPHTGTLQATVEYGRDKDNLDKKMNIQADIQYVQDFATSDVIGFSVDPTTGDPPNSYDMLEKFRQSRCRRLEG